MIPVIFPQQNKPLKILCLGAHCDDIEIGCGGTVLRLLEHNPEMIIQWIVFSSNTVRASEFFKSSHCFLGDENAQRSRSYEFQDGYFPHVWKEIKDKFEQLKTEMSPDIIFTHYRHDAHQDHRTISELTWNTFRNHLILEYGIPKYDCDSGKPNFYTHLSESVCRKKIQLLLQNYPSQAGKSWFSKDMFMAVLLLRGMESNSSSRFAEGFYAHKMVF